jgi:hypothetical protein
MIKRINIWLVLSLLTLIAVQSCKDPESPKAVVTVKNGFDDNKLAEGVIVTVYVGPQNGKPGYVDPDSKTAKIVKNTDASGKCNFDFTLENILQVKAEYPIPGDTLYGEGVLVLEEDKTYNETIFLRQLKSQL